MVIKKNLTGNQLDLQSGMLQQGLVSASSFRKHPPLCLREGLESVEKQKRIAK